MLVTMMALALAAPNPRVIDAPRKALASCIKNFESKSLAAKMEAAAYAPALKTACTAEAAALASALVAFDVAMGSKRASAAATADSDIADYLLTSEERFRDARPTAKVQ